MWVYGENMHNMNHKSLFGRWGGSEKSLLCCNSDDLVSAWFELLSGRL